MPVDRNGGDAVGEVLGREHGIAADLAGLLPALHDAAHDDIVDRCAVDPGAGNNRIEHMCCHVYRMGPGQLAAAFATGSTDCVHDIGFGHARLSDWVVLCNAIAAIDTDRQGRFDIPYDRKA